MARLLMCAPTHFGVTYDINPWMTRHVGAVTRDAQRQWERLAALLLDVGAATIELVEPQPGLPDIVFTANAALISGRLAVMSSFRYPERRGEETRYRERLSSLGYATTMLEDAFFEGAGDALFDRRLALLYFGYGWRSDRAAAAQLERLCGTRVIGLRLVDPRFYHLDTCLCPLTSGHVIAFMPAFSQKSQALLRMTLGEYLIEVDEGDALGFACNAVEIGDAIVLHRASRELRRRLDAAGYRVFETDLSDFHKAGGSSKCLTLKLDDGPVRKTRARSA
ncbi:MAG TPA: arginine deiminase-related protein [Candidatus Baltobacteraceae bacterium]|nr:arginine deiminase-related protein [Candidatus Baltobacteraceae bacterium]